MCNYYAWIFGTFFFSALFSTSQVSAQFLQPPPSREWEVSLFGGLASAGETSSLTPVEGGAAGQVVDLEYKSGYLLGLRITQNLQQRFGAELEYSFANQPGAFLNLSPVVPRVDMRHDIHSIVYSLLVYPFDRPKRIRPFAAVGGGASLFHISGNSKTKAAAQGIVLKDSWKFMFSLGGGVKYFLTQQLGVRFDVRDQISGVPQYGLPDTAPVLPGDGFGAAFRANGQIHNWVVNTGISYTWGD